MTKNTGRRFASPSTLTNDTLVLGVPVKEWNKAFIGNFEKSLAGVKQRVNEVAKKEAVVHVKKSFAGVKR